MNENLLQKCESRTFVKTLHMKSIQKSSKLWLQIRCCLYVGLILFFYTQFLWFDGDWRGEANKVPLKQHHLTRQLLSLASTSAIAIDLEHSVEDVSITEASNYSSHRTTKQTTVETTTTAAADTAQSIVSLQTNASNDVNCTAPAIFEFPADGLTRTQRQHGWIVLHILLALYCFYFLAVICDDYFLPAIELICQSLQMQADVVGATFMAFATSSPELFMNCIGTFVTKGDIGIGAIVGSSVFNLLAVPACCGLFVGQCVRLDWWPVSRDCLMYCMAVLTLIATLWDGKVMWYESLVLFMAYFIYMAVMFNNDKVARLARRLLSISRRKLNLVHPYCEVSEFTPLIERKGQTGSLIANNTLAVSAPSISTCVSKTNLVPISITSSSKQIGPSLVDIESCHNYTTDNGSCSLAAVSVHSNCVDSADSSDSANTPWQRKETTCLRFLLRLPITFLLHITVPDSRRQPSAKYLTFVLSILWIALISYVVAFTITVLGDTLNIPDSVMGLTILSAGMSVPEAVSSIIVTKQGLGAMGISNAIGSNTFGILLCLNVPWFIKAYFLPSQPDEMWITPNSNGLTYSTIFLLASVISLFVTLLLNRFRLERKVGLFFAILYIFFIICAALIELNVFFPVNLPMCEH